MRPHAGVVRPVQAAAAKNSHVQGVAAAVLLRHDVDNDFRCAEDGIERVVDAAIFEMPS